MKHPKRDFVRYVQAFQNFFEKNCVTHLSSASKQCPQCGVKLVDDACPTCELIGDEIVVEPYVSKHPCEVCGDSYAGMRENYCAFNIGTEPGDPGHETMLDVAICEDCVYYNEYHRLPDDRMAEVDKDVTDAWLTDGTKVALFGHVESLTCQAVVGTGKETVELLNIDTEKWSDGQET